MARVLARRGADDLDDLEDARRRAQQEAETKDAVQHMHHDPAADPRAGGERDAAAVDHALTEHDREVGSGTDHRQGVQDGQRGELSERTRHGRAAKNEADNAVRSPRATTPAREPEG